MKKTLQSISFLLIGMLLFSACGEEKTGESSEKIPEKIDIDSEEIIQAATSLDTVVVEDTIVPPPPFPPDPYPEPEPEPIPYPEPPPPMPEPKPEKFIVDFPDVEPVYPDGAEAMYKFIAENMRYPQIDKEMGNQGRVFLEFIVEKDGSLSNIKVLRGVSSTIDKEAKRVIGMMPKWRPGEFAGKIVRKKMSLPLNFTLD